jgi:hypothetical protein
VDPVVLLVAERAADSPVVPVERADVADWETTTDDQYLPRQI